jgi:hypothetical protein
MLRVEDRCSDIMVDGPRGLDLAHHDWITTRSHYDGVRCLGEIRHSTFRIGKDNAGRLVVGDMAENLPDSLLEASLNTMLVTNVAILCNLYMRDGYALPSSTVDSPAYFGLETSPHTKLTGEDGAMPRRACC